MVDEFSVLNFSFLSSVKNDRPIGNEWEIYTNTKIIRIFVCTIYKSAMILKESTLQ